MLAGFQLRSGPRTAATSKREHFVTKPLTIIKKSSILDVAAVLDPPLNFRIVIYNECNKAF